MRIPGSMVRMLKKIRKISRLIISIGEQFTLPPVIGLDFRLNWIYYIDVQELTYHHINRIIYQVIVYNQGGLCLWVSWCPERRYSSDQIIIQRSLLFPVSKQLNHLLHVPIEI
jgi:hypothetical protein